MFFSIRSQKWYKTGLNNRNQKVFPDVGETLEKEKKTYLLGITIFSVLPFIFATK
jgi:hypothetical protein